MSTTVPTGISVAEEPFDGVLTDLVSLHSRTRSRPSTAERFDWLYRRNPDGSAIVWTLREGTSQQIVGFTACLPRRIVVDGELQTGWNCADFSMERRFRTLGPAAKLRRQARLEVEAGRADFLYAHPNNQMAVIHKAVGHVPVGTMIRLTRPLRLGWYAGERLGSEKLGRLAGSVLDPLYRFAHRGWRRRSARTLQLIPNVRFDSRADELFGRHIGARRIIGVRDAAYLNWRYADNPLYATHAVLAGGEDRLDAYLLFTLDRGAMQVKDVFPPDDATTATCLIDRAMQAGWSLGLRSAIVQLLEDSPLLGAFRACGFRVRKERSTMYAFAPGRSNGRRVDGSPADWFVTSGDRDV